ncbi:MAG: hypothetical protein GY856_11820, partial [bacterium]|nr:hypothetical protein [bacterium]
CEYLASHGYVVTASPSVGRDSREMTSDPEGLEAQVRDLEFLSSRVRRHPHVDPERIGAMGYSWGGLSVPLLAMGNDQVDAVVVLEGSVAVKHHYQLARELPSFDPTRFRQPLMMMLANRRRWPARTLAFYHDVHRADAYLLLFNELEHGDFGSLIIELVAHSRKDGGDRDRARIEVGFATQCRYLRTFFDAYLKGDAEAPAYLRRAPEADQVPGGGVAVQWKPAFPRPQ